MPSDVSSYLQSGFNKALEMLFTPRCLICLIYPSSRLFSLP